MSKLSDKPSPKRASKENLSPAEKADYIMKKRTSSLASLLIANNAQMSPKPNKNDASAEQKKFNIVMVSPADTNSKEAPNTK